MTLDVPVLDVGFGSPDGTQVAYGGEKGIDFGSLPPEILAKLDALERIDMVQSGEGVESVAAFGEYVFGVVPTKKHRQWIEEKLNNKRVARVSAPESAKTTWAIVYRAWFIGKHPDTSNAFISATDTAAQKMAATVAGCIEFNPRWRQCFPNAVPDKEKGWSREGYWVWDTAYGDKGNWYKHIATQKDPTLIAGGVGSAVINGIRVTGGLDCDDMHDRRSKESDVDFADTITLF